MQLTVSVSDAKASRSDEDVIVTYSLGSCIGVTLYDSAAKVAGMLHFQLPTSTLDPARAQQAPCMFADTGMSELLSQMSSLGAEKRRLKAKIAGGAKMLNDTSTFDIGKRNHTAIRKVLWQHGLFLDKEDCGGNTPRTLYMNVADGAVTIKANGNSINF